MNMNNSIDNSKDTVLTMLSVLHVINSCVCIASYYHYDDMFYSDSEVPSLPIDRSLGRPGATLGE